MYKFLCLMALSQFQVRLAYQNYPIPKIPRILGIEEMIVQEARDHEVPIHLVLNTAWRESKFKPNAISHTGDFGTMQLNKKYFPRVREMDIRTNIHEGVSLLAKYWKICHNERLTWKAYNQGPRVLRRGR